MNRATGTKRRPDETWSFGASQRQPQRQRAGPTLLNAPPLDKDVEMKNLQRDTRQALRSAANVERAAAHTEASLISENEKLRARVNVLRGQVGGPGRAGADRILQQIEGLERASAIPSYSPQSLARLEMPDMKNFDCIQYDALERLLWISADSLFKRTPNPLLITDQQITTAFANDLRDSTGFTIGDTPDNLLRAINWAIPKVRAVLAPAFESLSEYIPRISGIDHPLGC